LAGMGRSSCRYRARPREDPELRQRLRALAGERRRFGYRRLTVLLRREGWAAVNPKRVYRLYGEEGLAVRGRKRQRRKAEARRPLTLPTQANQVWTMDVTHDSLASGRKFRTLNLMDGFTREAPRIEVDTSLPGLRVVRVLEEVARARLSASDPGGQRAGVPHSSGGPVGLRARRRVALHRAGPADPERLHRKFQRAVSGGVLERELVFDLAGGTGKDRGVAEGLQPGAPAQRPGISNVPGVRGAGRRARGVSPPRPSPSHPRS
jgi:hypothetical protein